MTLLEILDHINIKCEDDRKGFKDSRKCDRIDRLMKKGGYHRIHDGNLTKIYSKHPPKALAGRSLLLVSSHIDTVYQNFYSKEGKDVVIGTLDNSITNAALINLALNNHLPSYCVIAFTGNEEKESLGVDETVAYFRSIKAGVSMVISLDVTAVGFRNHGYTIENYFVRKGEGRIFISKKHLKRYLLQVLEKKKVKTIHHVAADPDDTWQFDEHNLNCFSFCLPSKGIAVHDDWMHDDIGVVVRKSSLKEFESGLLILVRGISRDLN